MYAVCVKHVTAVREVMWAIYNVCNAAMHVFRVTCAAYAVCVCVCVCVCGFVCVWPVRCYGQSPYTLDFRGFDSSRILNSRSGILRPTGTFPESLSRAILAGIILVGRLGVSDFHAMSVARAASSASWRRSSTASRCSDVIHVGI